MVQQQTFQPRQLPLGRLELPPEGVVHLWFLDLARLGSPLQGGESLPADALTPRLQRTLRRFYLRLLLSAYLGVPGKDIHISRQIRGKPVLDTACHGHGVEFSLAASGACCLIGVASAGALGVDLEWVDRRAGKPLSLARRYFSHAEVDALDSLRGPALDEAFLHTWACKEAVVKAAGHGIANRLCRFTVSVCPQSPARVLDMEDDDAGQWRLAVFDPGGNHLGAVALRGPDLRIEGFSLGLAAP